MSGPKVWLTVLAGLASLCAGAAAAADHLWAKVGATDAGATADLAACQVDAKTAVYHIPATPNMVGGLVGALLVVGDQALRQKEARDAFARHCMRRHGYVWLPLTKDEDRELGKLSTPADRTAWIDRFYASDLVKRLDAAWAPVVPPLPEGIEEPFSFDGLRLDPAMLTVAVGEVTKGGTVLSGPVSHVATARLKSAVDVPVVPDLNAPAGTIFYQVVTPTDFDPEQTFWCGPMTYFTPSGPRTLTYCVEVTDNGYEFYMSGLETWYAPPPLVLNQKPMRTKHAKLALTPSDTDLLGPQQLSLTVAGIDKKRLLLAVKVSEGKHRQGIWAFALPFEAGGTATLPFWTHRLKFTRSGKGVTVAFTADGDGSGWYVAPAAF
ncbi:MAG: hypothetical protein ACREEB_01660 [Caulobacteraceae bacterium]